MKKLLLLLLVFPLFIASCSDDDDDYTNSDLVGTWVLQSSTAKEVKTNNDKATQAIKDDIAEFNDEESYVFSSDGKFTSSDGEDEVSGTYNLKGNTLTLTVYGGSMSTSIHLSGNTFSSDIDETEYYQDEIEYLVPNETGISVSKVVTTYTYKRK